MGFPLRQAGDFLGDLPTWAFHVWSREFRNAQRFFDLLGWLVWRYLPPSSCGAFLSNGQTLGLQTPANVFRRLFEPKCKKNTNDNVLLKTCEKTWGKLWTSFIFLLGWFLHLSYSQVLLLLDFLTTESMTPFWSLEQKSSHFHFILCPGFPLGNLDLVDPKKNGEISFPVAECAREVDITRRKQPEDMLRCEL